MSPYPWPLTTDAECNRKILWQFEGANICEANGRKKKTAKNFADSKSVKILNDICFRANNKRQNTDFNLCASHKWFGPGCCRYVNDEFAFSIIFYYDCHLFFFTRLFETLEMVICIWYAYCVFIIFRFYQSKAHWKMRFDFPTHTHTHTHIPISINPDPFVPKNILMSLWMLISFLHECLI